MCMYMEETRPILQIVHEDMRSLWKIITPALPPTATHEIQGQCGLTSVSNTRKHSLLKQMS